MVIENVHKKWSVKMDQSYVHIDVTSKMVFKNGHFKCTYKIVGKNGHKWSFKMYIKNGQ
jgi:hypothetical protein